MTALIVAVVVLLVVCALVTREARRRQPPVPPVAHLEGSDPRPAVRDAADRQAERYAMRRRRR